MMGKYMLVIQRVAGLAPTVITSDDRDYLKRLADNATVETYRANIAFGELVLKPCVVYIHLVEISQPLVFMYDGDGNGLKDMLG